MAVTRQCPAPPSPGLRPCMWTSGGAFAGFRGVFPSARVPAQKIPAEDRMRMTDWLPARLLPACGGAAVLAATLGAGHGAMAQGYAVEARPDVQYAEHDGVKLTGNL